MPSDGHSLATSSPAAAHHSNIPSRGRSHTDASNLAIGDSEEDELVVIPRAAIFATKRSSESQLALNRAKRKRDDDSDQDAIDSLNPPRKQKHGSQSSPKVSAFRAQNLARRSLVTKPGPGPHVDVVELSSDSEMEVDRTRDMNRHKPRTAFRSDAPSALKVAAQRLPANATKASGVRDGPVQRKEVSRQSKANATATSASKSSPPLDQQPSKPSFWTFDRAALQKEQDRITQAPITHTDSASMTSSEVEKSLVDCFRMVSQDINRRLHAELRCVERLRIDLRRRQSIHPAHQTADDDEPYRPAGMTGVKPKAKLSDLPRIDRRTTKGFHTVQLEATASSAKKWHKSALSFYTSAAVTWTPPETIVPAYTHSTSIRDNVAATNQKVLHCWPYFGENVDDQTFSDVQLSIVDVDQWPRKVIQRQEVLAFSRYMPLFWKRAGCDEATILYYLLCPVPDQKELPPVYKDRDDSCEEDFDRNHPRWVKVFDSLPVPTSAQLQVAAWACKFFRRRTELRMQLHIQNRIRLSLWHVVRRSTLCRLTEVPDIDHGLNGKSDLDKLQQLACRVCGEHDCIYHMHHMEEPFSEVEESSDQDDQDESEENDYDPDSDNDWPPCVNYKRRTTLPISLEVDDDSLGHIIVGGQLSPKDREYRQLLQQVGQTATHERPRYYPCNHPGRPCKPEYCKCARDGLLCEKACGCAKSCYRRYRGCTCELHSKSRLCFRDDRCTCYSLGRECDADLCRGCRADAVVDPANRDNETIRQQCCQNMHLQLGIPKRTLLGKSQIHGFGLYAGEDIRKGDFIGEYRGEIVLHEERERRGEIYGILKMSYLFDLTKEDQTLDSHHIGNKVRFINHAEGSGKNGVCSIDVVIKACNMEPRIGMFATRDIGVGEEMFFDYQDNYTLLLGPEGRADEAADKNTGKGRARGKSKGPDRAKPSSQDILKDYIEPVYEQTGHAGSSSKKVVASNKNKAEEGGRAASKLPVTGKRVDTAIKSAASSSATGSARLSWDANNNNMSSSCSESEAYVPRGRVKGLGLRGVDGEDREDSDFGTPDDEGSDGGRGKRTKGKRRA